MVLDSILPLKRLKEIDEDEIKIKHIAVDISDISFLEKINKDKGEESLEEIEITLSKRLEVIKNIYDLQIKNKIPILTIYISRKKDKPIFFGKIYEKINEILDMLEKISIVDGVRITVIGKWYDIPNNTTERIRRIIDKTKDNESFFINLCINYDGKEEIIDTCKILGHKIKMGKIEPNEIDEEVFKENIYTSKFSIPERIIVLSRKKKLFSFLLWDSSDANIYFLEKRWNEINQKEIEKYFQ